MSRLVYIPPPIYALVTLGICQVLTRWAPIPWDVSIPELGSLFIALAVALLVWSALSFRRRGTTPLPTGTPTALVVAGPYRWTRNPMYLAILLALTSTPLFTGSLWFLVSPPTFWLIVNTVFIPYEEAKLEALFGAEYRAFQDRVKRWL